MVPLKSPPVTVKLLSFRSRQGSAQQQDPGAAHGDDHMKSGKMILLSWSALKMVHPGTPHQSVSSWAVAGFHRGSLAAS